MSRATDDETVLAAAIEALPPYARAMGMEVERVEDGMPMLAMDFAERTQGRPGYVHGGALAGLLEMAGFAAMRQELAQAGRVASLKPINLSTNYLRGAKVARTYALGRVTRAGSRAANIAVEAWQDDRSAPVAEAVLNVLIVESAD